MPNTSHPASGLVSHEIDITRIGYGTRTVTTLGANRLDAIRRALDSAGNHEYSEHASSYAVLGETTDRGVPILAERLSDECIKEAVLAGEFVRGVVRVDLSEVIGMNLDNFLDMISCKLVGCDLLMEVNYKVVGAESDGTLLVEVSGNAESVVETSGSSE